MPTFLRVVALNSPVRSFFVDDYFPPDVTQSQLKGPSQRPALMYISVVTGLFLRTEAASRFLLYLALRL